jgi:hypothetical protein
LVDLPVFQVDLLSHVINHIVHLLLIVSDELSVVAFLCLDNVAFFVQEVQQLFLVESSELRFIGFPVNGLVSYT